MNFLKLPLFKKCPTKFLLRQISHCFNPTECVPLNPSVIVTITGANSPAAQIAALILKQSPLIDEIRLFDYTKGPDGIALDLNHIDTSTIVTPFTGLSQLKCAIEGVKIIAICGGEAVKSAQSEFELLKQNGDYVRNIAIYASEFSPKAILCVAAPPITATVPLISEEYKKALVYDSRKIVGIMSLAMMRANSILAEYGCQTPEDIMCPVIGGMGYKTTVAVLSQTEIGDCLTSPVADVLRNKIANAENNVLQMKYIENAGPCFITSGFATARFVTSVARGLRDSFEGFECGFVKQFGETSDFLSYMGSVIKLGKHGVQSVHMPKIDDFECVHLQRAASIIREQIAWGESYVTGVSIKRRRRKGAECNTLQISAGSGAKEVAYDPTAKEIVRDGRLIPKTGPI